MPRATEPKVGILTAVPASSTSSEQEAINLHIGAIAYLGAFKTLHQDTQLGDSNPARYMCIFRCIELLLKRALVDKGHNLNDLKRNFGHDLSKLYNRALADGAHVTIDDADWLLVWADEYHDTKDGLRVRYDFFNAELPYANRFGELAEEIKRQVMNA